ncbi:MAG: NAD(P)H-hydrate dehydratase [Gemmatimonadaceae bacterium]
MSEMPAVPRVTTAEQSAARDAAAIAAGTPARMLMQRASAAAASQIAERYGDAMASGVLVLAGPGNNGGDAWGVARLLAARGARVCVHQAGEPRGDDARAERDDALRDGTIAAGIERPGLVVDGLLGTGARGEPRGAVADGIRRANAARDHGASIVALDVPSGIDATTGEATLAVRAHCTLTFATVKRGLLVARGNAGRIVALDIGVADAGHGAPRLADGAWVRAHVPPFAADAHKGTRKKIAIVGGHLGMAGAPMLAARAAMRTGVGIVRMIVAPENVAVVQTAVPTALARPWPGGDAPNEEIDALFADWADAVVIGPGMGSGDEIERAILRMLRAWRGPVVVDADALNIFSKRIPKLRDVLAGRPAIITPHAAEMARLLGCEVRDVLARRFDIGAEVAAQLGATVMLKGVPTVVSSPGHETIVSAAGTPALATGGSGDILAGIAGTLLAQIGDAHVAAACAAWAHGRAAEIAGAGRTVRGVTLADVEEALALVWRREASLAAPVLAELPPAGDES